jgi:hypothetical protein
MICHPHQLRITRQLAQAQQDRHEASQRDVHQLRDKVQDLVKEFTRYMNDRTIVSHSDTFRAVVEDIEEVRLPSDDHMSA